jgi:hypothetical protein
MHGFPTQGAGALPVAYVVRAKVFQENNEII